MRIVVGHVDRPEGAAALDQALTEAVQRGAELVVLRVLAPVTSSSTQHVESWDHQVREERERVKRLEGELRERHPDTTVELRLASTKSPTDELLSALEDLEPALAVIGIRRRSRVGKMLLGSTAQDILLQAHCPVLAVKPPDRPSATTSQEHHQ
jgi:nucleotide-binding universal stress UspA family protein